MLLSSLLTSNYVNIPMALEIPERWRFPHVSDWQDLGTDVTKLMSPALQKKIAAFMCKNYGPTVTLWNDPPKNRVLFWGWNVKIWWPAHRKTIEPMEMRCKLDKKTWNPLQNAKRHRIHKHQKGNVATFNYPPGGLIYIDLPINMVIFQFAILVYQVGFTRG